MFRVRKRKLVDYTKPLAVSGSSSSDNSDIPALATLSLPKIGSIKRSSLTTYIHQRKRQHMSTKPSKSVGPKNEHKDVISNYTDSSDNDNNSEPSLFTCDHEGNNENDIYSETESDNNIEIHGSISDLANADNAVEIDDFNTLLADLSRQWLNTELNHHVSKECSDRFWSLGMQFFHRLFVAKQKQKIKRKVPQFSHIRRKMYDKSTPNVDLTIGYQNKETEEIVVEHAEKTPVNKYPPSQFKKVFEIASVNASDIFDIHNSRCPRQNIEKNVSLSLDGVSESKSTSVSMDVFTIKMKKCRTVYPHRIVRPLGQYKVETSEQIRLVLSDIRANGCNIEKIIADNPKRSNLRCAKCSSSSYPCEYCVAKGLRVKTRASEAQHISI